MLLYVHFTSSLERCEGFGKIDWHRNLGQVLSNELLKNIPHIEFFIRISQKWQLKSTFSVYKYFRTFEVFKNFAHHLLLDFDAIFLTDQEYLFLVLVWNFVNYLIELFLFWFMYQGWLLFFSVKKLAILITAKGHLRSLQI